MSLIFLVPLILIFGLSLAWITRSSPDPAAHSRAILWGLAVLVTVVFSGGAVKVGLQLFGGP